MKDLTCQHCKSSFPKSPRHCHQSYCAAFRCQRARKAAWQRIKMESDEDYQANQKEAYRTWAQRNPDYMKTYRQQNPEQVAKNRLKQHQRNRKNRSPSSVSEAKTSADSGLEKIHRQLEQRIQIAVPYRLIPAHQINPEVSTIVTQQMDEFWMVPAETSQETLKVKVQLVPSFTPG